jgi:tripartite-type tricarboxylate transporter receptor subunit TctC
MNRMFRKAAIALSAATLFFGASAAGIAAEFDILNGKTLRFVIGGPAGQNNDRTARLFIEALKKKVPGMTVAAQNNAGASGQLALTEAQGATGDAITLVSTQPGPIYSQLAGTGAGDIDLPAFHWLGSMAGNQRLAISPKALNGQSFEQLKGLGRQLVSLAASAGSSSETETLIVNAITGLNMRVITGFDEDERTAMLLSGEADIVLGSFDSKTKALVDSGDVFPLFQIGGSPLPSEYSSTPALRDLAPADAPKEIIEVMESLNIMGRLIVAAPNTAPEVVEALRTAFDQIMADPEVVKSFAGAKMTVAPTSGKDVQSRVEGFFANPETIELFRSYIDCGKRISAGEVTSCKSS